MPAAATARPPALPALVISMLAAALVVPKPNPAKSSYKNLLLQAAHGIRSMQLFQHSQIRALTSKASFVPTIALLATTVALALARWCVLLSVTAPCLARRKILARCSLGTPSTIRAHQIFKAIRYS